MYQEVEEELCNDIEEPRVVIDTPVILMLCRGCEEGAIEICALDGAFL